MRILSIETSCDETAVAILDCQVEVDSSIFKILSHALISQIDIHREFGGVFPAVAKREHAKNLVPLTRAALEEAEMLHEDAQIIPEKIKTHIGELLARESDMAEAFIQFITETEKPEIDAIAVTYGPGLAPALWVAVNFAQALALAWNVPLVPINHMEGHFLIGLARTKEDSILEITHPAQFPVLGLLISGGHTQLLVMKEWLVYRLLGETRDDAIGEAFDKVARMLDLPYPGGPEISRLAERQRTDTSEIQNPFKLPRPMIDSKDYDFSFSGLKTAVLYILKDIRTQQNAEVSEKEILLSEMQKEQLAQEFEDAATNVLMAKTSKALEETCAQTLVIGGGVSANVHIQKEFARILAERFPHTQLCLPPVGLTGDNAVMIGIAGFYRAQREEFAEPGTLTAEGNLALGIK